MTNVNPAEHILIVRSLETGEDFKDIESAHDTPVFIEIVGVKQELLQVISEKYHVHLDDLQDLNDLDERPRLWIEDEFSMLILRVPIDLHQKERDYATYPMGIITNGESLIFVKHAKIPVRRKRILHPTKLAKTMADLIYNEWARVIHSFETGLDIIEATIKETEEHIIKELYPTRLDKFFKLSGDAVFLEAALRSNLRVLRQLARNMAFGGINLDPEKLEELEVDLRQQLELIAIYRQLIDNAMQAYDSVVGHNLNSVMKVLTSVSLILSIPTLLAGIYGMNVVLPFGVPQDDPNAFALYLLVSIVLTVPLFFYLRRKNLV
jgi:magnesium transporter